MSARVRQDGSGSHKHDASRAQSTVSTDQAFPSEKPTRPEFSAKIKTLRQALMHPRTNHSDVYRRKNQNSTRCEKIRRIIARSRDYTYLKWEMQDQTLNSMLCFH